MHDMKDDEPGIALARLHKTRERNKRAVDHALAHLEREGVKVPEATIAALYEDALWFANMPEIIRARCRCNSARPGAAASCGSPEDCGGAGPFMRNTAGAAFRI